MKFITFYFSGTGNTKWAVEQFNRIVTEKGHESKIYSIDNMDLQRLTELIDVIQNADFIGFANPIYGGNIPPIMRNFIGNFLEAIQTRKECQKPIYFINTFAYVNGFGPFCAKKLFRKSELKLIGYANIQLCNNISSPKLRVKPINPEKLQKRKEAAKAKLAKFADNLLAGKHDIKGIGFYLLPNIIVRKNSKKSIVQNYKIFSVNMETCKKCMLCVNSCPTKSITYTGNTFHFSPACTACMRCYNHCPTFSILFDGEYADPKIYARYLGPDKQDK
jgi:NAD-dependent dihydropyrimidine dehydrogenase PreA subunit